MTPAQAIGMLDRQLARHGEDVNLVALPSASKGVRAFVRGYKPTELAGSVRQGDRTVALSPTSLVGTAFEDPEAIAKVEIAGRRTSVEGVEPVYLAGVLVRINLQVRG